VENEKTREETRVENEKTREETRVENEKTREQILNLLEKKPEITASELAKEVSITEKGVEWQLKKLREEGIIQHIGPNKGGHWKIIKNGDDK
ncbi:MAG: winged helix-turn-helix domain-containing protein, partial [Treponema sp.]|nr:winged helix-turn-helix domain-containing protein [Treponema sp.]